MFAPFLSTFLSLLTPRFILLPVTVPALMNMTLLSKKEMNADEKDECTRDLIKAGRLLVAKNSVLMLDESDLKEGKIEHDGVVNLKVCVFYVFANLF